MLLPGNTRLKHKCQCWKMIIYFKGAVASSVFHDLFGDDAEDNNVTGNVEINHEDEAKPLPKSLNIK